MYLSTQSIQAVDFSNGDLIKASSAAVYYYNADGDRYSFPNEKIYFSWYNDFSKIKIITDAELATIPLKGNVTYKPGVKMIKIKSSAKVYAVDAGNVLRWINAEIVANYLYGSSWKTKIDDIPDSLFADYTIGDPISHSDQFDKTAIQKNAIDIYYNKNLSTTIPDQTEEQTTTCVPGWECKNDSTKIYRTSSCDEQWESECPFSCVDSACINEPTPPTEEPAPLPEEPTPPAEEETPPPPEPEENISDTDLPEFINLMPEIISGYGSYGSPYVINTNEIEFQIGKFTELDKNRNYKVSVHMSGTRSCATQIDWQNLTWSEENEWQNLEPVFNWTGMAGKYYLKLKSYPQDGGSGADIEKIFVHSQVPPVNSFNLPYAPPTNNEAPITNIEILDTISGDGNSQNPFIIPNSTVRFRIDGSHDPDGEDDLKYGTANWAINTDGHHPKYSGIEGTPNPLETYLFWSDWNGVIFEWDTTERPSETGEYSIELHLIDQHGAYAHTPIKIRFIVQE